jgi:hypothetical protein
MESYVAVNLTWRETICLSVYIGIEWRQLDWFVVSLFIVAAVILSLMLHLPLE